MKLPSLTQSSTWVWSEDPALDAPALDATEDVRKEWARKLDVARDTGQWDGLVKAGHKLTKFTLRIVPALLWRKLIDSMGGELGVREANSLAVRLALTAVSDLDGFDGRPFVVDQHLKHLDGYGKVAGPDVLDLLDAYLRHAREENPDARDPIDEMADAIARRQSGIRPLSSRG